ncbi:MAG: hypothetical protein PHY94_03470 [Candidatus Omnitrophica bacterium]|nr:hypothetical protein [Candidatus Omnitrophota bacterium]
MPTQRMQSLVFFSQTGCLLPLLIMGNLFFGWLFLKPLYWLGLEGALILLFLLNAVILSKKISFSSKEKKRKGVIDIEGKVISEKKNIGQKRA